MNPEKCRADLLKIFEAGVAAADPFQAVLRHLKLEGDILSVGESSYDLREFQHIYVLGAGKASAPMASGLERILGDRLSQGRVVVKSGCALPLGKVEVEEAGHPVPDLRGIEATRRIWELAVRAGERDLVFCLISGGGSALFEYPVADAALSDLQSMTTELLSCGAEVHEINALRKHLSTVKGGQLARACAPATVVSLILSDVVGDPLDVIASGPTAPDPTSYAECMSVVAKYGLAARLPPALVRILREGLEGRREETPKPGDPVFRRVQNLIVGNNLAALVSARDKALGLGYRPLILSSRFTGETRVVARFHADIFREARLCGYPVEAPACFLSGGETTVTVRGKGRGGRNLEFSLALALELQGLQDIFFVSGGTDGTDGPTEAAGAFADGTTVARGRALGLEALAFLEDNDSYSFFQRLGDLLVTGPTRTNVMDLRICILPLWREEPIRRG